MEVKCLGYTLSFLKTIKKFNFPYTYTLIFTLIFKFTHTPCNIIIKPSEGRCRGWLVILKSAPGSLIMYRYTSMGEEMKLHALF